MRDPLLQTLATLNQRLIELAAWRYISTVPFDRHAFRGRGDAEWVELDVGDPWPSRQFPVSFRFSGRAPEAWAGKPVEVHLDVGGEGLLLREGAALGGLNPYHQTYPLTASAEGGERFELSVEAVPFSLFGKPVPMPRLERSELALPDPVVMGLHEDLAAAHEAASYLAGTERRPVAERLADLVSEVLTQLPLPRRPTDAYLSRLSRTFRTVATGTPSGLSDVWEAWTYADEALRLPTDVRDRLHESRKRLREELARIRSLHPPEGRLLLSGHAHIDLAWLWPLEETKRKARRTFATALTLLDAHDEFHFSQSMAQLYRLVEEDDPELFRDIQKRVREGRWEIVGGMWVEPDGNLPSGEAWVRQLLYGQRYFESRFGRRATVCWLPDTFGYAGNLPQLLRQAGMPYFFTTKLSWNETNEMPHDLYHWEGIDGTRVLAHTAFNPRSGYNGRVTAEELSETWQAYRGKRHHHGALFPFGYGDGGGGPSKDMLERFDRLRDFPGMPQLEMSRVEDFYRSVDDEPLPTWTGEQYLELHRGTYTTQARLKALNRKVEHALVEAEASATLAFLSEGEAYPRAEVERGWLGLLRNQFHDILPGSSVRVVNEEAERELQTTLESAERLTNHALERLSAKVGSPSSATHRLVVWNLSLDARELRGSFPRPPVDRFRLVGADGRDVAYQLDGERFVLASRALVPGMGYCTLDIVPGEQPRTDGMLHVDHARLENPYIRVEVGEDGTIRSLFDRRSDREALAGRANQIWVYDDIPRFYEAWEIDRDYAAGGREWTAAEPPTVGEDGPALASIRVRRRSEGCEMIQDYALGPWSKRLEIRTWLRWHGRRSMVRALFPMNIRTHEAVYETAFGAVARPTHRNTAWDTAKFEVPGHRWVDLGEAGYGVSLLNDGKYGHSASGNTLGLTLLRTPVFPDPYADEGDHRFSYALYPHAGDWRTGTVQEAHDLNAPLRGVLVTGAGGPRPSSGRLLDVDGDGLRLAALKMAESESAVILRLYEAHGGRGRANIHLEALERRRPVSILEEPALAGDDGFSHGPVSYSPYQVLTFEFPLRK